MAINTTPGTAGYVNPGVSTIAGKFDDLRIKGRDVSPIIMADAKIYPLLPAIMAVGGDKTVPSNHFIIWEDEDEKLRFTSSQVSGGAAENIFYLSAANSRHMRPGHILMIDGIWTDGTTPYTTQAAAKAAGVAYHPERARVLTVGVEGANTPVTVVRETAQEVTTSMTLVKMGSAMPDGWRGGTPFSAELESVYNLIQNFSEMIGVDENRENETTWGPEDFERDMVRKRRSFNRQLAMAFHAGVRGTSTGADGRQRREMGGMYEFTPIENVIVLGGVLTITKLNELSLGWGADGSDDKYAFVGPELATFIANKQIPQLVQNDELAAKIGIPMVKTLELTHVRLHLITDYTFKDLSLSTGMVIYDLPHLKRAHLDNMNIRVVKNVQLPGEHLRKDEITGSMGLWRVAAHTHHRLENVTG